MLEELSKQNNSILKTSEAVKLGFTKPFFLEFVRNNGYKMLSRGVYLAPDSWEDGMFALQIRYAKAVLSHETALYLLELSEREPLEYEVTVPHGYNSTNLKQQNVSVFSVKPEWYSIGVIECKTPMENTVRVYNAERTLCDIFKGNCKIEIQDKQFAIKQYLGNREKIFHCCWNTQRNLKWKKLLSIIWRFCYDKNIKAAKRFSSQ